MRTPKMLVFVWLALSALACGDDATTPHDADHHAGEGTCGNVDNCMDTVHFEEGLVVEGDDGKFKLTVDMHNTLAPSDNEWMVTITDAGGGPAANAQLTADVYSVDCMHGGPLPAEELTTDADGMATLQPVALHGGPWDVIVEVESGSVSDTITVHLCIPGEEHGGTDHMANAHGDTDAG